jgi:hypothetical protein
LLPGTIDFFEALDALALFIFEPLTFADRGTLTRPVDLPPFASSAGANASARMVVSKSIRRFMCDIERITLSREGQ